MRDSSHTADFWKFVLARTPARLIRYVRDRPALIFVLRILVLLTAFVIIDRTLLRLGHLGASSYHETVLLLPLLEKFGLPVLGAGLLGFAFLIWKGALPGRWSDFGHGPVLRGFVVFAAAILVWPFVTQGYNPYLGQEHLLDAIIVTALLVWLWFRPVVIFPLTLLLAVMLWRLIVPSIGGSILAHKLQVFHVLSLFCAVALVHALTGWRNWCEFVFLTACLIAGAYFTAALAKIELGWWELDQLYLLPVSAYGHGWLHSLGPAGIGELSSQLRPLDVWLRWAVLGLESSCLVFLFSRRLSLGLLIALIGFHIGVLALYGFFFWTWILIDLGFIVLLLKSDDVLRASGNRLTAGMLSAALIASSPYWAKPPVLGWFDTGLSYNYRFVALGASGRSYVLHPGYFSPYEDVFTMTAFSYLPVGHSVLTGAYGVTKNKAVAKSILRAKSAEEIFELERTLGTVRFNAANTARLVQFIEVFVRRKNSRPAGGFSLSVLAPPPQFISLRAGVNDTGSDPIRQVRFEEATTRFNGHIPEQIRLIEVARITIGE